MLFPQMMSSLFNFLIGQLFHLLIFVVSEVMLATTGKKVTKRQVDA